MTLRYSEHIEWVNALFDQYPFECWVAGCANVKDLLRILCEEEEEKRTKIENVIVMNGRFSYWYSISIIKGPWPRGEPTILMEPGYSFLYAAYVLCHRWPEAEGIIMTSKDSYWKFRYQEHFNIEL